MKKTINLIAAALVVTSILILNMAGVSAKGKTVQLNKRNLILKLDQTASLKIKNTNKKVIWSSSNTECIKVTVKGKVKAVGIGTTKVKAKCGKKTYYCKAVVKSGIKESDVKMKYNNVVFTKDFVEKVNSISFEKKIVKDKMAQKKLCAMFTKLKFDETVDLKGLHKNINGNAETMKVGELTPLIFTLSDGTQCCVDSTESQFGVTTAGKTKYYNISESINENEFWETIDEFIDRYCEK